MGKGNLSGLITKLQKYVGIVNIIKGFNLEREVNSELFMTYRLVYDVYNDIIDYLESNIKDLEDREIVENFCNYFRSLEKINNNECAVDFYEQFDEKEIDSLLATFNVLGGLGVDTYHIDLTELGSNSEYILEKLKCYFNRKNNKVTFYSSNKDMFDRMIALPSHLKVYLCDNDDTYEELSCNSNYCIDAHGLGIDVRRIIDNDKFL